MRPEVHRGIYGGLLRDLFPHSVVFLVVKNASQDETPSLRGRVSSTSNPWSTVGNSAHSRMEESSLFVDEKPEDNGFWDTDPEVLIINTAKRKKASPAENINKPHHWFDVEESCVDSPDDIVNRLEIFQREHSDLFSSPEQSLIEVQGNSSENNVMAYLNIRGNETLLRVRQKSGIGYDRNTILALPDSFGRGYDLVNKKEAYVPRYAQLKDLPPLPLWIYFNPDWDC